MHKYPKVNFIGNKEKIANWIISEFPLNEGTVLDVFCGGCSVAYALKSKGYNIIANDILYANYVIAKALISNQTNRLPKDIFNTNFDSNSFIKIREKISFLENKLYFPNEIDELASLIAISENFDNSQKYLFLSLLRRAMIRKLPYSRMNIKWSKIQQLRDEEYSYNKYKRKRAYHNESFRYHIEDNITAYNYAIFKSGECDVFNYDALECAEKISNVDITYLDPPYPSTMNNYDAFYGLFDDMFSKRKQHTDFTDKSTFIKNLNNLIERLKDKTKYIILSQNTKVKPGLYEIKNLLLKYGKVEIREKKHNYQVTGKDNKNSSKELLFILKV